jgi:hypothetical protein
LRPHRPRQRSCGTRKHGLSQDRVRLDQQSSTRHESKINSLSCVSRSTHSGRAGWGGAGRSKTTGTLLRVRTRPGPARLPDPSGSSSRPSGRAGSRTDRGPQAGRLDRRRSRWLGVQRRYRCDGSCPLAVRYRRLGWRAGRAKVLQCSAARLGPRRSGAASVGREWFAAGRAVVTLPGWWAVGRVDSAAYSRLLS